MNLRIATVVTTLALAAAGCGGTDVETIDSAQEFCEALVAEGARVVEQCLGSTADLAPLQVAYEYGFHCAILDGENVAYDAPKGEACLAALQGWDCSQYFWIGAPPPDCYDAFDGLVADGEACTSPWQCQSLRCDFDSCNAPGTCIPTASQGQACEAEPDWLPCRVGSECGEGTCAAWPAPPAPVGEGADCSEAPCADAFWCDSEQMVPTCAPRLADGEACSGSSQCPWGSGCEWNGEANVCVRDPRPGEACQPGQGECVIGAYCSDGATCAAMPHLAEPCGPTEAGEEAWCIDGWCDVEGDGTCKAVLPVGSDCTLRDQCGFEAACIDGICAPIYCFDS